MAFVADSPCFYLMAKYITSTAGSMAIWNGTITPSRCQLVIIRVVLAISAM